MLYVSHREPSTKVLGPGQRYALWVQGCEKRCPHCIFPAGQLKFSGGRWISVAELWREIKKIPALTGVTISGGEPFLQAPALARLVKFLRADSNLDVMIFTGYTLDELKARRDSATDFLLANIDILVDGDYRDELNTGSLYRGSDNQQIHFLTPKYLPFSEIIARTKNRSVEFVYRGGELFMVGIPAKNFGADFINRILEANSQSKKNYIKVGGEQNDEVI